jgi:hypothetical protein
LFADLVLADVPSQYDTPRMISFKVTSVYLAICGYAVDVFLTPFVHVLSVVKSVGATVGMSCAKICNAGTILGRAKIGVSAE